METDIINHEILPKIVFLFAVYIDNLLALQKSINYFRNIKCDKRIHVYVWLAAVNELLLRNTIPYTMLQGKYLL